VGLIGQTRRAVGPVLKHLWIICVLADLWLHAVIDNDPQVRKLREKRQEIVQMLRKPKGIQRQVQITNRLETPFSSSCSI